METVHRFLASADFSGADFTHAYFQKIAKNPACAILHYSSEGIPSLIRFWLLMTSLMRI